MRKQYHTRQASKKYARTLLVLAAQVVLFSLQTLVNCMLLPVSHLTTKFQFWTEMILHLGLSCITLSLITNTNTNWLDPQWVCFGSLPWSTLLHNRPLA
jgi:hypothetical protein